MTLEIDWSATGTLIAAIAAAAGGLGALYLNLRRAPGERRQIDARADGDAVTAMRGLIAELNAAREELELSRDQEEDCTARLMAAERRNAAVAAELALALRRAGALEKDRLNLMLLAKFTTQRSSAVTDVLDHLRADAIVLTTPANGGTIEWCTTSVCAALGRTLSDITSRGWRELIHPEDLERTEVIENAAIGTAGEVRNRYRHTDGHYVAMRWFFTVYENGSALSVVWFDRRRTDPPWPVAEAHN